MNGMGYIFKTNTFKNYTTKGLNWLRINCRKEIAQVNYKHKFMLFQMKFNPLMKSPYCSSKVEILSIGDHLKDKLIGFFVEKEKFSEYFV